ncbi:prepilin-type N-terminal cleavage/methylation domain-containing protein [Neobacillus sp. SAB-20_R2A]|uniref:prepilin-type N-terminal cleavage/methylation domain-containing protein n=1 Tax=Neobacillus sp. SAB-20_R2A TaxID=3120519 RepID=UPI003C6E9E34
MVQALKQKMKEQKGFTLIELLAVIVILGIIAAIAIPAIGNVINKSDNKAKVQEGIQIINAAKLYVANTGNLTFAESGTTTKTYTLQLQNDVLSTYLDHVKDNNYTVIVTKDSNNKYTYSITNHESGEVVGATKSQSDVVDEQTLTSNAR